MKPGRFRKIPAGIRKALLFPMDPFGRQSLSGIPHKLIRYEAWSMFTQYWVLSDRVVVCPAVGAPAAAMAVEWLAASGVESILLVGSCGGLGDQFQAGEVLRVDEALSACGTTTHYFPSETRFTSTVDLRARIHSALVERGFELKPGTVVTTDAPYRETPAFLNDCRHRGAEAVEMECAAVFAVARFRQLSAAAVLVVADRVDEDRWIRGGLVKYALSMRRLLSALWELEF